MAGGSYGFSNRENCGVFGSHLSNDRSPLPDVGFRALVMNGYVLMRQGVKFLRCPAITRSGYRLYQVYLLSTLMKLGILHSPGGSAPW